MEKFAIDLDRVLDEFELNEDLESVSYQRGVITDSDSLLMHDEMKSAKDLDVPYFKSSSPVQLSDLNLDETSPLDLSEADFAPSLPSTLLTSLPLLADLQYSEPNTFNHTFIDSEEAETDSEKKLMAKSYAEDVNLLHSDFLTDKLEGENFVNENQSQEFSVADSIKPLHNDETINKDYLITFGRKREPPTSKTVGTVDNIQIVPLNAIDIRNEADGSVQTKVEEIVEISPIVHGVTDVGEQEETYTTPDDGSEMPGLNNLTEPASFFKDIEVTEDDIQRYLEIDVNSEDLKLGFEDFYTPVTDTVLRESDLLGLENDDNIILDTRPVEMNDCGDEVQCERSVVNISELTDYSSLTSHQNEVEQSIYDLNNSRLDTEAEAGTNSQRISRPTSLSLPSKIQEPTSVPPPPDSTDPDSAMEDGEANVFGSLTATAGSPDAGLGLSPDDDLEESSDSLPDIPETQLTEEEKCIGKVAPLWVPDSEAINCMECSAKFTVIRRRHHCRACGRVLCGNCCGLKAKMTYLDNKEARVCQLCLDVISKVQQLEAIAAASSMFGASHDGGRENEFTRPPVVSRSPNPNNPSEYCSLIPPLQQATPNLPPPTVMVPVGVLKRVTDGPKLKSEPKQVMFSDGIRPGGDLTELDGPNQRLPYRRQGRQQRRVDRQGGPYDSNAESAQKQLQEYSLTDNLDPEQLLTALKEEASEPLVFIVSRNLKVSVKIVDLSCCAKKTCWCIVSQGMSAVGQDEVVVLIEYMSDEQSLPTDVFYHLNDLYEDASKGSPVTHMGHTVSTRPLFGAKDHVGFLYFRPTFQCLKRIPLPQPPFLFAVLLQKWEIPWAKVFPLRLLLRLGAEFRYYPCPLYGVRFREPVFYEIGHTIVNLLADFRNYQYSLPTVSGLVIHMKDGETTINFPRNRYDEVVKALNSGIDHVLALAAAFSTEADSHLVCIQNDQGNYQPQAISLDDKPRIVTGASFVVFNGALKSSSGLSAKSSIVEDGVMVHIPAESITALRQTLKDMKDYVVACGPIGAEKPDEVVRIQWVDDDKSINIGVRSSIDGKPLDGVTSIRIHRGMDYVGDGFLIRWTEIYLIKNDTAITSRSCDPTDASKVSDTIAQACCLALAPHLSSLYANGLTKIGLRVTLDTESVGYEVGASEKVLPPGYMNDLDSELVPAIHSAASIHHEGSLVLELIFHVLQQ